MAGALIGAAPAYPDHLLGKNGLVATGGPGKGSPQARAVAEQRDQRSRVGRMNLQVRQRGDRMIGDLEEGREQAEDRKSVVKGKSVSVRVGLGGRRFNKKTK